MPKTKRKTVRKVKKIKQKQTTNVVVNIDQSRRTRTTRREPKQQNQPAPHQISFKPSYGSTENSDLTKAITLLLANKLTTPNYNSPTGTTPNPIHTTLATPAPEKSGANLLKTPRVRLGNWLKLSKPVNPPQTPIKEEKVPDSPDSLYSEDMTFQKPTKEEQEKTRQRWSLFSSGKKKTKENEEKRSEEGAPSPRALFQGEETGGGASRPPSPENLDIIVGRIETKLMNHTPDALRELFTKLYPDRKFPSNIKNKEKVIKKYFKLDELLEKSNRAELNRIDQASSEFITGRTKNVTTRKIPTLGIRT